ncbi:MULTISPECIES: DUF4280 domain-containing protein [Aquimarina]|uniref:DUF4280 domain-containing protein n=1 Tax=Aquimarina TaxID=290174 RepID=UPI000CDEF7AC|nr:MULTISPECIES: DUF4280 domain-containing protein [Aquimarina]
MSVTGHIVCNGALCQCKNGFTPDKLKVLSAPNEYVNDAEGAEKLIASTMDIGIPLEKGTFGQCKLQPSSSGYLPCIPSITTWQDFYDKVTLSNQGQVLVEDSKGICAIAGTPCVEFIMHGQQPSVSNTEVQEANEIVQSQLNPLIDPNRIENIDPFGCIQLS